MMPEFKIGDKWVSQVYDDYFIVTEVSGVMIKWDDGECVTSVTEEWWDYWGQTYRLDELQQVINILKDYE
jgi:hypothetical protein